MVRPLVFHPDPRLRTTSRPVKKIGRSVRRLLDDMVETMYEHKGVGLAANQVGVTKRLIVVDPGDDLRMLVNPEILSAEGEEIAVEGCLSIPEQIGEVPRATHIRVRALTPQGKDVWFDADGYLARIIQHEVDHINGVLFLDRAVKLMDNVHEDEEDAEEDGHEEATQE